MVKRCRARAVAVLVAAMLPGCSLIPSTKPNRYPSPGPGPSPGPPPSPSPTPGPAWSQGSLRFVPVAIRAQAQRPLALEADAAPTGFTFEGRVESTDPRMPFAVDPDLRVTEARDDRGRDLAVGRSIGEFSAATTPGVAPWPRWIPAEGERPAGARPVAGVEWECFGLSSLPGSLDRMRGFAVAWVIAESVTRDAGITGSRGAVELVPDLRMTVGQLRRSGDAAVVDIVLERGTGIAPYSGMHTDVPRIVSVTVLDQRGERIADVPVQSAAYVAPEAGERSWPVSLSFFVNEPQRRPTTLRMVVATRLERVQIPFELRDVPVAEDR